MLRISQLKLPVTHTEEDLKEKDCAHTDVQDRSGTEL